MITRPSNREFGAMRISLHKWGCQISVDPFVDRKAPVADRDGPCTPEAISPACQPCPPPKPVGHSTCCTNAGAYEIYPNAEADDVLLRIHRCFSAANDTVRSFVNQVLKYWLSEAPLDRRTAQSLRRDTTFGKVLSSSSKIVGHCKR